MATYKEYILNMMWTATSNVAGVYLTANQLGVLKLKNQVVFTDESNLIYNLINTCRRKHMSWCIGGEMSERRQTRLQKNKQGKCKYRSQWFCRKQSKSRMKNMFVVTENKESSRSTEPVTIGNHTSSFCVQMYFVMNVQHRWYLFVSTFYFRFPR